MFAAPTLDKASPIPLYLQLAGRLEALIAEGAFPVGARLPGEEELARQYDLNRNTVRHALTLLVRTGLVRTERGVGSFVRRSRPLAPIHRLIDHRSSTTSPWGMFRQKRACWRATRCTPRRI
jgi:DNA-binding GntR family transcriptional regulator